MFVPRALVFSFLFVGFLSSAQDSSDVDASILEIDQTALFGDVKLGDPLNKRFTKLSEKDRVLERLSYSSEGITWYRYADSPTKLDGSTLRYVYYGFKDNRLVEIAIAFAVQEDLKENTRFFEKLEKQFRGTRVNHEMWLWSGENTGLDFSGYCGLDTCSMSFLYIFPKARVNKFTVDRSAPLDPSVPTKAAK